LLAIGGVLVLSIRDHEYGASLDLQQLYPFRMKLRFVEVGSVEAENPRTPIPRMTASM
jgi:hypothetical protein